MKRQRAIESVQRLLNKTLPPSPPNEPPLNTVKQIKVPAIISSFGDVAAGEVGRESLDLLPRNDETRGITIVKPCEPTKTPVLSHTIDDKQLSPEQQIAYEKFKRGENLFITGPGGTGKTLLIQHFVRYANTIGKKCQVTALTGCAALLLKCNARTIHSWSGIRIAKGDKNQVILRALRNKKAMMDWRKTDILIVDEVSMMSQKIFDILCELGQNARHGSSKFGGIQVIFCGDFYQLPPVGDQNEPETGNFCFESRYWNQIFPPSSYVELTTIFRQNDEKYISILQQVRLGELNAENRDLLSKYVGRTKPENYIAPVKLFPIRAKTEFVNKAMYAKLDGEERNYPCIQKIDCQTYLDSGDPIPPSILNFCKQMDEQDFVRELELLKGNLPFPPELDLKINTLVMCRYNVALEMGICNGTQGIVIGFSTAGAPIIKWANGVVMTMEIQYFQSEECPTVAIGQYPLCLAWAMTIHKIQGASLDMAEMDLGTSIFEYSQTYVALSRVRSLDGLYLSSFNPDKIRVNPKVRAFYQKFSK